MHFIIKIDLKSVLINTQEEKKNGNCKHKN